MSDVDAHVPRAATSTVPRHAECRLRSAPVIQIISTRTRSLRLAAFSNVQSNITRVPTHPLQDDLVKCQYRDITFVNSSAVSFSERYGVDIR